MGMLLCASRGVEWKSINYLKTRGLQNNIGETQMTSLFNIGKKDERGWKGRKKDFESRDRARMDQGGWWEAV